MKPQGRAGANDTGTDDPRLVARTIGVLMSCGGALVFLVVAALGIEQAGLGLAIVGFVALVAGLATIGWARNARPWAVHLLFAAGAGVICLGSYFAGAGTGLYGVLLVWVAIVAATFFSRRAVAAHIAWIMIASGTMLALVDSPPGPSPFARWAVGGVLMTMAATVMSGIAAGRRATEERLRAEIEERERLQCRLEHLAEHDPLTGVANRRRLDQELAHELERARRKGTSLCVASLDLDGLKEHNDAYGHAAGDRLLKQVASAWEAGLGERNLIARTGGDEFVVVLPECTLEAAEGLIDGLHDDLAATCPCSVGVAHWDGRETAEEVQIRADLAMYAAKARSRIKADAYSAATRVCQTGSSGRS